MKENSYKIEEKRSYEEFAKENDPRKRYFNSDQIKLIDEVVPLLIKEGLKKEASRFCDCGRKFILMVCRNDNCQGNDGYPFPFRCELRICPRCCQKMAKDLKKQVEGILKYIPKTRTHKFGLLTLTQKVSSDRQLSSEDLKKFNENKRKLINKYFPKKKNCGAISVLEIGKNFNIHAHILVYGFYIPQNKISEYWKKITGDSYIVDIRTVKNYKAVNYYLLKYISKPPFFYELEDYVIYLKALKGTRRLHRYGIMYGFITNLNKEVLKCPICGDMLYYFGLFEFFILEEMLNFWELYNEIKQGENNA